MSIIEIIIISLALSLDAFAVTITNLMVYPNLSRMHRLALPIAFGVFQGVMLFIGYFAGNLAIGFIAAFAGPIALVILVVIGGRMVFEAIRDMRKNKSEAKAAKEKEGSLGAPESSSEAGPDLAEEVSDESSPTTMAESSGKTEPVLTEKCSDEVEPIIAEESSGKAEPVLTEEASGETELALAEEASGEGAPVVSEKTSDESEPVATDKADGEKEATLSLPTILAQGVATSLDALIVGVSLAALAANIILAAPLVGIITFLACLLGLVIGKRLGLHMGGRAQLIGGIILILIGIRVCFF